MKSRRKKRKSITRTSKHQAKSKVIKKTGLQTEEKYLSILKELPDIVYKIDQDGHFTFINNAIGILGYKPEELVGKHFSKIVPPDDVKLFSRHFVLPQYKGKVTGYERAPKLFNERRTGKRKTKNLVIRLIPKKNRNKKPESIIGTVIAFGDVSSAGYYDTCVMKSEKKFLGTLGIIRNITATKQAEEKLHYQADLLQNVSDAIISTDLNFKIQTWNKAAEKMYGWKAYEIVGKLLHEVTKTNYPCNKRDEVLEKLLKQGHWRGETNQKRKDGSRIDLLSSVSLIRDYSGNSIGIVAVNYDITERKRTEEQIKISLKEKEALIKEVHHRVKNNLQIISSLLNLQAAHIHDEYYKNLFQESQNRIKSMVLVHEKLYQSKELTAINVRDYINGLLKYLCHSYGIEQNRIAIKTDIEDISMNIDIAIPCGLIITELVSNSLTHAFVEPHRGSYAKITIKIHLDRKDKAVLIVSDNGIGFPDGLDFKKTKSLGMQLVCALTEQLSGNIKLTRDKGTTFTIMFKKRS